MNTPYRTMLAVVLLATHALPAIGQLLRPLDMSRQADVNRKIIDPAVLNMQTVPLGVVSQPTVSQPPKVHNSKSVSTTTVPLKTVSVPTVATSTLPLRTVTLQNFTAKRAAVNDRPQPVTVLPAPKAPVRDRTIHAFTAAGEEELKQQLRKIQ